MNICQKLSLQGCGGGGGCHLPALLAVEQQVLCSRRSDQSTSMAATVINNSYH